MKIIQKLYNKFFFRLYIKNKLKKCGINFRLGYLSNLECPSAFTIGDNFFTGPYAYLSSNHITPIIIGDNVMFGPYVKVIGGNHNISWAEGPMMKAPFQNSGQGIEIEDDVWIGIGATILDGARISEGTVVAAGAVITCKTIPYGIYGGVPARLLKTRFTKEELLKVKSKHYTMEQLMDIYDELY